MSTEEATSGIVRLAKEIERIRTNIYVLMDAGVDAGYEPLPGYWNARLVRELERKSLRAFGQRLVAKMVAQTLRNG